MISNKDDVKNPEQCPALRSMQSAELKQGESPYFLVCCSASARGDGRGRRPAGGWRSGAGAWPRLLSERRF